MSLVTSTLTQSDPHPRRWTSSEFEVMKAENLFGNEKIGLIEGIVRRHDDEFGISLRQWSISDCIELINLGLLGEPRIELIAGEIFVMSPPLWAHALTVANAAEALDEAFGRGF